jgi:zinc protease
LNLRGRRAKTKARWRTPDMPNFFRLEKHMRAMRRTLVMLTTTLVVLCIGMASAAAQTARDMISSRTLENGLDVIVIPSNTVPITTIEITVKNGAFTEPPEFNGLSHLYEHMFFKGNAVIPNQEAYLRRMRELGIVFNGTTSTERVNYFFTLPSDNLEAGLVFMRDAITTPKFDSSEFEKEKQVVLGEVDRNESSPYYEFNMEMNEKVWFAHPTRKDPLGDRDTITTATIDKMNTMKDRYYMPNNSVLVISGDVQPAKAFELAQKHFGAWEKGPDPFVRNPVPKHPPLSGVKQVIVQKPVKVPYLEFVWHGPSVGDDPKATFAADVLSYIIGQPTSKFHKNLVESGIVLGASIGYYTQAHTGPITLSAQAEPAKLEAAIPALLAELEKLDDPDYFTDEQLQNAKTILAIQDRFSREKISSFTHTVSFWWAVAGLDYYLDYVENLQAVTREDIVKYVRDYIFAKPYVAGVLLSPETASQSGLDEAKLKSLTKVVPAAEAQ